MSINTEHSATIRWQFSNRRVCVTKRSFKRTLFIINIRPETDYARFQYLKIMSCKILPIFFFVSIADILYQLRQPYIVVLLEFTCMKMDLPHKVTIWSPVHFIPGSGPKQVIRYACMKIPGL